MELTAKHRYIDSNNAWQAKTSTINATITKNGNDITIDTDNTNTTIVNGISGYAIASISVVSFEYI